MEDIEQQKIINNAFVSETQEPIILKYVDKKEYKKLLTKLDNITIPDKEKYNHIYKLYFPIWLNVKTLDDLKNVDNWYIFIACSTLLFAETDLYFVKQTHKQIKTRKLHLKQYKDAINKKYWQVSGINNLRLHQLIAVNYLDFNDVDNWIKGHVKAIETKKRFNELKNKDKRTADENDEFNKLTQRINEWNIDHINGDKNNNCFNNLQIITHKDNLSKRANKNDSCVYEWDPADIIPLRTVLRNKDINVDFYYITKNNIYKIIKSNRINNRKSHTVINNNGTKTQLYRRLEPFNGIYMLLRLVDKDNRSRKRVMVENDDIERIYDINKIDDNRMQKIEIEDNDELNRMEEEEDYFIDPAE